MIVVAGLSPAWQQILLFDEFRAGEVNRARESHWCASGKVLNVAVALSHLGAAAKTVALVGGATGDAIEREFAARNIPRRWVAARCPTRTCTTILDRATGATTELVENVGSVTPAELAAFRAAFVEEAASALVVVLSGSLPAGTPRDFPRELLAGTSSSAVLDLRGEELIASLACNPLMVKPNREELAVTLNRPIETEHQIREALRELNHLGAQWAVLTQGGGDVWASSKTSLHRFRSLRVDVVNPIGSGDCLAAGFAWATASGRSPVECVQIGIAAAADNVSRLLPGRLDPRRVLERAAQVAVQTID